MKKILSDIFTDYKFLIKIILAIFLAYGGSFIVEDHDISPP